MKDRGRRIASPRHEAVAIARRAIAGEVEIQPELVVDVRADVIVVEWRTCRHTRAAPTRRG